VPGFSTDGVLTHEGADYDGSYLGKGGEHDSGNSQFDRRQGVESRFVEVESGVPPNGNSETGIEPR